MPINRRRFLQTSALGALAAAQARSQSASDKINMGFVGVGNRGSNLLNLTLGMAKNRGDIHVGAVCDVYEKRKQIAQELSQAEFATRDYREVLNRPEIDAVVVATPDHWHAPIAIAAMKAGKDVYLEKPMTHTIEEAKEVVRVVKETGACCRSARKRPRATSGGKPARRSRTA